MLQQVQYTSVPIYLPASGIYHKVTKMKKLTQIISLDAVDNVREKRRDILKDIINFFLAIHDFRQKNKNTHK
jgi:hypothetical protein